MKSALVLLGILTISCASLKKIPEEVEICIFSKDGGQVLCPMSNLNINTQNAINDFAVIRFNHIQLLMEESCDYEDSNGEDIH